MKDIVVSSLNVRGETELLVSDHQSVKTAFRKSPVTSEFIKLGMDGFAGDIVGNRKYHGGNDKSVCCYNSDHFQYWKEKLNVDLGPAAFGENLTLEGPAALEANVCIGDRYKYGDAIVEVSEPRGPCYVIGIRHNLKDFATYLQKTGFTGFYLRTIQSGTVKVSDKLIHLSSHPEKISVMDVNNARYGNTKDKDMLRRLVDLEELTSDWRERFQKRLEKL